MDVFEVVADPTRRGLLDLLAEGELAAGQMVAAYPALSQPSISRHLRVLREAGLVEVRSVAQRRIYTLRPRGLAPLEEWLERYRRYWSGRLDSLERHLADTHDAPEPTERTDS